jgi:thioredoxin-related protein
MHFILRGDMYCVVKLELSTIRVETKILCLHFREHYCIFCAKFDESSGNVNDVGNAYLGNGAFIK